MKWRTNIGNLQTLFFIIHGVTLLLQHSVNIISQNCNIGHVNYRSLFSFPFPKFDKDKFYYTTKITKSTLWIKILKRQIYNTCALQEGFDPCELNKIHFYRNGTRKREP